MFPIFRNSLKWIYSAVDPAIKPGHRKILDPTKKYDSIGTNVLSQMLHVSSYSILSLHLFMPGLCLF